MDSPRSKLPTHAPRAFRRILAGGALLGVLALPATAEDEEFANDLLTVKGREVACRVLWQWADDGEEILVRLPNGRHESFEREDVSSINLHRDRTASFLNLRREDDDAQRAFVLVNEALAGKLPDLARLQAYYVLTLDPEHAGAHEFLGHRETSRGWKWLLDGKQVSEEEFHERTTTWKDRLVLKTGRYHLESDAGLARTVATLFDLERLYVEWMGLFAEELQATEVADEPQEEMTLWLFRDRDDSGFTTYRTSERKPYYDPSREQTTEEGNPNIGFVYYRPVGGVYPDRRSKNDEPTDYEPRPYRLFDIATQQLLYTTLVMGKRKGGLPADSLSNSSHWVEVGLGHWMERRLQGPPGFARLVPFEMESSVVTLALADPRQSPLNTVDEELSNLIGLETQQFYKSSDDDSLHFAKAQAFTAWLLEEDPPTYKRGSKTQVVGSGRAALLCYLRGTYSEAKRHSSSAFDNCMGKDARVEDLGDPWRAWLQTL